MNLTSGLKTGRLAATLAFTALLMAGTSSAQVATENRSPGALSWDVHLSYDSIQLTVSGPSGEVFRETYTSDPAYDLVDSHGYGLTDGLYSYELRLFPSLSASTMQQLEALRDSGDTEAVNALLAQLGLDDPPTFSSSFTISNGSVILNYSEPEPDIVQNDDVIVQQSLCVGTDCANGENFGFDTIRLKENNTRIGFQDTSTGSFPSNDWQLEANSSASGGSNHFALLDVDAGRYPFRVEAGAPNNAFVIEADGDIGMGTLNPVVEMHSVDGDTPTLRLEQDASAGFGAQTWDIAGNETNFFVRDVTNGSALTLRLVAGAPAYSLSVAKTGEVGFGVKDPSAELHIVRNHNIEMVLSDTSASSTWKVQNTSGNFRVIKTGTGIAEMTLFSGGNLTIGGTLSEGSSREIKNVYDEADGARVLERLGELPISEWSYKANSDVRHLGPMAEDFHRLFGFGPDPEHIATRDLAAVSMAAVKELQKKLEEKDAAIAQLEERLQKLEAAIAVAEPR